MSKFKITPISTGDLEGLLSRAPRPGRRSKGQELIESFVASGEAAGTVDLGSSKDRDSMYTSVTTWLRREKIQIGVKRVRESELVIVDLAKADAGTVKAFTRDKKPAT